MKFHIGQTVTFVPGRSGWWSSEDIGGTRGVIEEVHEYPADVVAGGAVYGVRRVTVSGATFGGLVFKASDALAESLSEETARLRQQVADLTGRLYDLIAEKNDLERLLHEKDALPASHVGFRPIGDMPYLDPNTGEEVTRTIYIRR